MAAATWLSRIDGQPVAALQYTGDNLADVRDLVEVSAGDWVVRGGRRAYAVRSFAYRGHCREVPVE